MKTKSILNLNFQNTSIKNLPIDPITDNYIRKVENACLSLVKPTPIVNPQLVHVSSDALKLIDVDINEVSKSYFLYYFCGNQLLPGSEPVANCYCGHQFGIFAGQLGDGRAITLGEIVNEEGGRWELQLKGSGLTPYSRHADGRAVLRSSIREFLCSEAMHYLGIPTSRAATIITSDTVVDRDKKYDGNVIQEKATVVSRLAPSFLRFGSFQIADPSDNKSIGPSYGNPEIVKTLLNYVIEYHYPHIFKSYNTLKDRVIAFAKELSWRTADTVSMWQAVGFTHGVLNTDNMSILGLTIDYGPFAFMDDYNPDFVPNTTDTTGRYSYANQSGACKWNLKKLFMSIGLAIPSIGKELHEIAENFCDTYDHLYLSKMRGKLGLIRSYEEDKELVESLFKTMHLTRGDFTNIFRSLSQFRIDVPADKQPVLNYILTQTGNDKENSLSKALWVSWLQLFKTRIERELVGIKNVDGFMNSRSLTMDQKNPKYILRNSIAQNAIEKAEAGDYSEVQRLLKVLSDPYDNSGKYRDMNYDKKPDKMSSNIQLSCSS